MTRKTTIKWISPYWYTGCDQTCRECYIGARAKNITAPMDERIMAIDTLAKYNPEEFFIVGGNPTLDPYIEDTVHYIKSRGTAVEVLSNSWAMPHVSDKQKFMQSIDHPAATFFGADADMHDTLAGAPGSFERLKKNLQEWRGISFVPVINIMPQNKDHIYKIIGKLREFINFDTVWTQRIMPYGNAIYHSGLYLKASDINPVMAQLYHARQDYNLEEISFDMTVPKCIVDKKYHGMITENNREISFFFLNWRGQLFGDGFYLLNPNLAYFGGKPVWEVEGDLESQINNSEMLRKKYLPEDCKWCNHYDNCFGGWPVRGGSGRLGIDPIMYKGR